MTVLSKPVRNIRNKSEIKNSENSKNRIGFLATGSELVSGEILNTNSQKMAEVLQKYGMNLGEHVLVDDRKNNIAEAFRFLLARHQAIICIGGLGPTSDDLTRHAVADVLGLELVFNPESFERIKARVLKKYSDFPNSNKRQAYFPQGSFIIPNAHGTADGCEIKVQDQWIYLLPGPPQECLPMFENQVLSSLRESGFATEKKLYCWKLENVSEAWIAEKLEEDLQEDLQEFNLVFGYRAYSPYLDIKLGLSPGPNLNKILEKVENILRPYLSSSQK